MNPKPVIDHLRDEVPTLRLVGGAAEWERALQGLVTLPAAFVLPDDETGAESPFMDQIVEQAIRVEFPVLVAVRNLADDEGAAAMESAWPVRKAVRSALLARVPEVGFDGCEFVSDRFFRFDNGVLWFLQIYRTGYVIRSDP